MKMIAKNTILGLKATALEPTLAGETFECSLDEAAGLIESDAAEEFSAPVAEAAEVPETIIDSIPEP